MTYNLSRLGITDLNAMQQEMLQTARKGTSTVLLSPTGSGKTLAYLLPLLQKLDAKNDNLQALVIVPSRELATQTADVARRLCSELRVAACYGGRPTMEEHQQIRGLQPQLVVATPGRLLDHLQKGNLLPDNVQTLVIDEFDKSLELGFREQMQGIITLLPHLQQRILLSATDTDDIPDFVGSNNYTRLNFLDNESDERISLHIVHSPEKDKLQTLRKLLGTLGTQKSLIFVGYRESVERVGNFLEEHNIMAGIFHGGMEQRDRERALYRFMNGSANILVSTDLASRGLDITDVDNIIHYHLPPNEETSTHRNGRTARWDTKGSAYFILAPQEHLPEFITDEIETYTLPTKVPAPEKPLWVTLYIGKGKKDKISRGDIVGFLTKQGNIESSQIGRIDVLPHWSYVAVKRAVSRDLLNRIKGLKIKGLKTIYTLAGQ
ncbi:MAG: DEAD/DEAH box helicase [Bacteroidaceae bacterium]|jgi:superfamily II DNA/RNA helicase|nr:DEAD/DEAH box helicase [Bacteroidaceae bacterium]